MLAPSVSTMSRPEALKAAMQAQAKLDILVAVTRHSSFVAALDLDETYQLIDCVKAKAEENPQLLAFAKAVYTLCWDDEVSAEAKRSFLDLNRAFLDKAFKVSEAENAYLIEQFTQEAINYKKCAGLGRQKEYLKLFAEHFRVTAAKLKKKIESCHRVEQRLKEVFYRIINNLALSLSHLAGIPV